MRKSCDKRARVLSNLHLSTLEEDSLLQKKKMEMGVGFMRYNLHCEYGVTVPEYKIICAGYDERQVMECLNSSIAKCVRKGTKENFLLYSTQGHDPRWVTYNIISRSNFPTSDLCIRPLDNSLFYVKGDESLLQRLAPNLLKYKEYHDLLKTLPNSDLAVLYTQVFLSRPPKFLFARNKIIRRLLCAKAVQLFQ